MRKGIRNSGFTLVELMVVIAVVGILAAGILVAIDVGGIFGKADLAKAKSFAESVQSGLFVNQVGKWSFDDQTNPWKDTSASGYGYDGTPSTPAPEWKTADQCGLGLGGCLKFNGTDNYVEYTGFADFTATSSKTVSAWFKLDADGSATGGSQPVVAVPYFRIYVRNPTNEVRARTDDTAAREAPIKALGQGDRNWHHAVGVFSWNGTDTQTLTLYVDGTLIGSRDHLVTPTSPYAKYIGRISTNYFTGFIDEVSIYDKALVASQIQNLYASGVIRRAVAFGN